MLVLRARRAPPEEGCIHGHESSLPSTEPEQVPQEQLRTVAAVRRLRKRPPGPFVPRNFLPMRPPVQLERWAVQMPPRQRLSAFWVAMACSVIPRCHMARRAMAPTSGRKPPPAGITVTGVLGEPRRGRTESEPPAHCLRLMRGPIAHYGPRWIERREGTSASRGTGSTRSGSAYLKGDVCHKGHMCHYCALAGGAPA